MLFGQTTPASRPAANLSSLLPPWASSMPNVRGHPYYSEYHGHPVQDLENVVAALRSQGKAIIWLAGDSNSHDTSCGAKLPLLARCIGGADMRWWRWWSLVNLVVVTWWLTGAGAAAAVCGHCVWSPVVDSGGGGACVCVFCV